MTSVASQLRREDPFIQRLLAYFNERFNPIANVLLIISYYSSNQFLAQVLQNPCQPVTYSHRSLLGAIVVLCIFFHLRVFDEHKDYKDDCRFYPNRVLQQGLITLGHLKILGGLALVVELFLSAYLGLATLVSTLVVIGFSVMMLREFFMRAWLKQHFLLYAITHMLIMPLLAMIVFSATTQQFLWQASGWYWFYAFVGFFVTFNWEISRKIRAPSDEIHGVDSYTKIFGTYGAAYAVLLIRVIDTGMVSLVGCHIGAGLWFYGVLVALFAICTIGFLDYRLHTNTKTAKRMEFYAGMYIVAFDLTLAITIMTHYGITIAS